VNHARLSGNRERDSFGGAVSGRPSDGNDLVRPEGPSINSHVRKGVVIRTKPPMNAAGAALRPSPIVSPICSATGSLTFVSVPARRASRMVTGELDHALTDVAIECWPFGRDYS
jgi:hypothetical protein